MTQRKRATQQTSPFLPRLVTFLAWFLFFLTIGLLIYEGRATHNWQIPGLVILDGLTLVMWLAVTFFSGIVHSYSLRYMAGDNRINLFYGLCFGFTLAVMVMTAADHIVLFSLSWLAMGVIMSRLIGLRQDWGEARMSGRYALYYFVTSTILIAAGGWLLAHVSGSLLISQMVGNLTDQSGHLPLIAGILLFAAAMIQSGLFPFQGWLISSMTSPTPASALMHAGFVNAGGILLARFAPLFYNEQLLWLIVLVGGIGALFGKFWKFVHPNFKRKLGCSTVSQMGFMILQCGLGFFTAAITHLILHGFYKAYLFLSSGSRVEHSMPSDKDSGVAWLAQLPAILVSGVAGGYLFALLTGKNVQLDSGLFLIFVVALTIIHGTQSILKRSSLVGWSRVIAIPLLILPALAIYALFFNGVSLLMADVPMAEVPMPLTWAHGLMMALYLFAFLAIEFEWYKMSRRLYVLLLNISQPHSNTVLTFKK